MKNFIISVFISLCLLFGNTSLGQLSSEKAAQLEALFAGKAQDEPGGVLEIRQNGKKIFRKVFGVTNLEQPSFITGETVFTAASVSKQFTAAGILILVKQNKLSLNDDVRKYIPELPDYGRTITIKQLLTHTSGMRDWWNVTYITSTPSGSKVFDQQFALSYIIQQKSLNYQPGERYSYTNTGYDLASIIIERISKMSFQDFIKTHLLLPAGMTKSKVRTSFNEVIPHLATGYILSGNRYVKGYVLDETYGAAGLLTTAEDLAKWNHYIFNSKEGKEIASMREERYVLNNGDTIAYATGGVEVSFVNGVKEVSHSGLEGGYRSLCTYYPEPAISVTYMSNNKDISTVELKKNIASILFGKSPSSDPLTKILAIDALNKKSSKSSVSTLSQKTGVYLNTIDPSDFVKLHEDNGNLMSYAAKLHQVSENVYTYESNIYYLPPGKDSLQLNSNGNPYSYYRVPLWSPTIDQLGRFVGSYFSTDADVLFEIKQNNKGLIAYRSSGDSVVLTPVFTIGNYSVFRGFDHGLRANFYFENNGLNVTNRFKVSLPRAYDIPFTRINTNP